MELQIYHQDTTKIREGRLKQDVMVLRVVVGKSADDYK